MQVTRPSVWDFAARKLANWKLPVALPRRRTARARRGVSILEVLFAIAVTTIGLLGAIAVFPVASAQARKGRISDAMAVAGMSAAHDFDVRGMRKAVNWVAHDGANFISPYNQHLAGSSENWFSGMQTFCLDPRYIAANSTQLTKANTFPAGVGFANGMKRITLGNLDDGDTTNDSLHAAVAEALFMFDDDLTFERPGDRSVNAFQIMDSISSTPYKRQSDGHMTWMATIVPKTDRSSTELQDTYVLSIVVFYDRPMDDLANSPSNDTENEYTFTIGNSSGGGFPGSGITGGEVLLKNSTSTGNAKLNRLKANDWILLTGATASPARPVAKWYRILDVDDAATAGERYVTLFGQDWDTSIDTNAVYVEGVIGVYEKTIRLDFTPRD